MVLFTTQLNAQGSFSVQHGETTLGDGTGSITVDLDQSVTVGQSWIIATSRSAENDFRRVQTTVRFEESTIVNDQFTQLVLQRENTTGSATVTWQVITGSGFTVQRGITTLSGTAVASEAISQVNLNRAFIVTTQRTTNSGAGNRAFVSADFNNNTTIRLRRGATADEVTVAWFAVEWEGSSVQSGTFDFTEGNSTTVSLGSAVALNNSFLIFSLRFDSGNSNVDRIFTRGEFSSTTALTFTRNTNTNNVLGTWFAVTHSGIGVQSGNVNGTDMGTTWTSSLSYEIPLSRGFTPSPLQGNVEVSSSNIRDGYHTFRMLEKDGSSSTVDRFRAQRGNSDGNVTASWFAVNSGPSFTSLNPNKAGQGITGMNVTVTGSNFQNKPEVSFSGTGITVNSVTFGSSTELMLNIDIDAAATTGSRNLTIENPDGGAVTANDAFTVNASPLFSSLEPNKTGQGVTGLNMTVKGSNFQNKPEVSFSGTGITVNSVTFGSSTELTVNLNIDAAATIGSRNMTIKNPDGGAVTANDAFTINTSPSFSSLDPDKAGQGVKGLNVTVEGSAFQNKPEVSFSGTGITVNSVMFASSTSLTLNLDIDATSATGSRNLTIKNPDGGSVTATNALTVLAPDAGKTTANVPNGTAGEVTHIKITIRDAIDHLLTGAAGKLNLSVTDGPNSGGSFNSITDNEDGTYSTSYTPPKTGTDEITITLDGTQISGSPIHATVVAGGAEGLRIQSQPGQTTAGQQIEGPPTVLVTDELGNPVKGVTVKVNETGGYSFDLGTINRLTDNNGVAIFDDLVINKTGRYRLIFDSGGVDEKATSNEFDVMVASAVPNKSTAVVSDGRVAESTNITITVRDEFNNLVSGVADRLALSISGANEGVEFSAIIDNGDGTYKVSYTPTRPGIDQIAIRLNGEPISGSPFTSKEGPGAIETLVIVSGNGQHQPTRSWLEEPLVVRALDRFDNPVPGELILFEFSQTPADAEDQEVEDSEVRTSNEGLAETYVRLGSEGGTYRVKASIGDVAIDFSITADKTVPDPSFSDTVKTVIFTPDPNSFMFAEFDESLNQPQGFNFEFWVRPSSLNSNGPIAGRWDEELGRQFRISLFGNTLQVELMDEEGDLYEMEIKEFFRFAETGTKNISGMQDDHQEFEWTQISLVVDPSNELVQLYKNGFESRRSQILSDLASSTARLEVGRGLDGQIHEIRLWDRPRSRTEIQALKDLILTGSEENLVLYHTFDEESNDRIAVDIGPHGNNFLLSDLVSRGNSLRDVTHITLSQNEEFILQLAALDKTGGELVMEVTKLPENGRLFQLNPDLTRGEDINVPGSILTDPFNRFLYVPNEDFIGTDNVRFRIFDQFENFVEPAYEFEVLKVNRPPIIDLINPLHFFQTETLYVDLDTLVSHNKYDPQNMVWEVEMLDVRYAGKEDQLEQHLVVEIDQESRRLKLSSTLLFIADDIQMRLIVNDPEGLQGLRNILVSVRPIDEKPGGIYDLKQNYPNPYNTATIIEFWIPIQAEVMMEVYDLLGRKVVTLVDQENFSPGIHDVFWEPTYLASGIYFYRMEALGNDGSRFVKTKQLTIIK